MAAARDGGTAVGHDGVAAPGGGTTAEGPPGC